MKYVKLRAENDDERFGFLSPLPQTRPPAPLRARKETAGEFCSVRVGANAAVKKYRKTRVNTLKYAYARISSLVGKIFLTHRSRYEIVQSHRPRFIAGWRSLAWSRFKVVRGWIRTMPRSAEFIPPAVTWHQTKLRGMNSALRDRTFRQDGAGCALAVRVARWLDALGCVR
jgi:hypothetical protein